MQDYEKLGAFYLGRRWDAATGKLQDDLVLYDSPDLTTHAVIIGMTGSGKTGLGISLLEEAAIDRVPVIAIDPKGDLGNLLLTFPELRPADFEPWVDAAMRPLPPGRPCRNSPPARHAGGATALANGSRSPSGSRDCEPRRTSRSTPPAAAPGGSCPCCSSFEAPPEALRADADLFREHVQAMVTGLLTLAGIDADPVASREHILLSSVLHEQWKQGRNLDLAGLIGATQNPGIEKIGVMNLETFYPSKDRFALAMRLNNLLAASGSAAWTEGEPLDASSLLFTPDGRPRVSVMSIAHLSDAERMFFVTVLLNEIVAWMRVQSGTSSLRAILYMDEVFGFLPPVAAPPSKLLLLTLLKQARAFGLGVVLSTQNPVDLDYKALSNAGTWFIGRLQTEQDRNRVRDGLISAAPGGLDPATLDATLASLGKRTFLLNNVHEKSPVLLQTRWAMSYLRGPLTRDDIRRLTRPATAMPAATIATATPTVPPAPATPAAPARGASRPVLPPSIPELFGTATARPGAGEQLVYLPSLLGTAHVAYVSSKYGIDLQRDLAVSLEPRGNSIDWSDAEPLPPAQTTLAQEPDSGVGFAPLPSALADPQTIRNAQSEFRAWLRAEQPLVLKRSTTFGKLFSAADEPEGAFRARLQQHAREERDNATAALRKKYDTKLAALEERARRAEQAVTREKEQATGSKIDAAVSVATTVLGALLGRKTISATSVGRASTAMRKAGYAQRQSGDVDRANETLEQRRAEISELDEQLQADIAALDNGFDAQTETLEDISVRPKASDISVGFCGIGWLPVIEDANGNLRRA